MQTQNTQAAAYPTLDDIERVIGGPDPKTMWVSIDREDFVEESTKRFKELVPERDRTDDELLLQAMRDWGLKWEEGTAALRRPTG